MISLQPCRIWIFAAQDLTGLFIYLFILTFNLCKIIFVFSELHCEIRYFVASHLCVYSPGTAEFFILFYSIYLFYFIFLFFFFIFFYLFIFFFYFWPMQDYFVFRYFTARCVIPMLLTCAYTVQDLSDSANYVNSILRWAAFAPFFKLTR